MSVEDVVEGVCMMLDRMAEKAGVELDLFIEPGIPPNVLGDAGRLRQVLVNLLGNAIKFSGDQENRARVWVRAVLAERSLDQVVVKFEVADTGIGMDSATVSQLFTPFTRRTRRRRAVSEAQALALPSHASWWNSRAAGFRCTARPEKVRRSLYICLLHCCAKSQRQAQRPPCGRPLMCRGRQH